MAHDPGSRYRPSSVIRTLNGRDPAVADGAFVDETAVVIGMVRLGAHASVWPTAVIRGDTDLISVGERTNVQDGAVLHADEGVPCRIGAGVTVGHRAVVHGCTVEDDVLVGMGAIVMNRARVGAGSILGAGAVVPEGVVIPPNSMALGVPARVVRPTTEAERDSVRHSAAHYVAMIARHRGA